MIRNFQAYRQVMRTGALDDAARAEAATRRLRETLVHAHYRVPLHRRQMAQVGYDPRVDFRGPADLAALPIMTKDQIKSLPLDEVIEVGAAARLKRLVALTTSGSTGTPLTVYRTSAERALHIAKWLRVLAENGYRPRDKVMSFTAWSRLGDGRSVVQRFGLFRRRAVSVTWSPSEAADAFLGYRPNVLYGVRTNLVALAEELILRGLRPKGLRLVVAGGEIIRETDREICRLAFGVPLTEYYGSVEIGATAYQRPGEPGLAIPDDLVHLEFLDEAGRPARPGAPARIIATDLVGRTMPFVRYDIGDRVVFREVAGPGGRPVRVIDRVIGRDDDYAPLPCGGRLTYLDFYEVMDHFMGIHQFRIHQRGPDRFDVLLAADRDYIRRIERELGIRLGMLARGQANFEILAVDRLAPDDSGKSRILVSDVTGAAPALQAAE